MQQASISSTLHTVSWRETALNTIDIRHCKIWLFFVTKVSGDIRPLGKLPNPRIKRRYLDYTLKNTHPLLSHHLMSSRSVKWASESKRQVSRKNVKKGRKRGISVNVEEEKGTRIRDGKIKKPAFCL